MIFLTTVVRSLYFALSLRIFSGLTFIVSSVAKLPNHTEFEAIVKDYDLLPDGLASFYATILPWAEILVGVYLIGGILFRPALVAAIFMAFTFMIANISAVIGDDPHCGSCFGDLITLPAWQALILDIALLLFAAHLFFRRTGDEILSLNSFLKTA